MNREIVEISVCFQLSLKQPADLLLFFFFFNTINKDLILFSSV